MSGKIASGIGVSAVARFACVRQKNLRSASWTRLVFAVLLGGSGCWEVPVLPDPTNDHHNRDGGSSDLAGTDGGPAGVSWKWESPIPQGNHLRALFGRAGQTADSDELYMAGEAGVLVTGHSTSWKVQKGPGGGRTILGLAGYVQDTSVRIVGVGIYDLGVLHTGTVWADVSPYLGTGDGQLTSIWAAPTAGDFFVAGTTGRVYRVAQTTNSLKFTAEAAGVTTDSLFGISGAGTSTAPDVYAVGANGRVLHRATDGKWAIEANAMVAQQLNAVWVGQGALAGNVFAAGDAGVVLRKTGTNWAVEKPPTTENLTALVGVGDEVYAAGNKGTILRRKSGVWQMEAQGLTSELLSALWATDRGAGTVTVYAVGNLGTILRRERDTWTQLSSRVTQTSLSSVWAASPSETYAVGNGGLLLKRTGVGAQGAWRMVSTTNAETLNAVSGLPAATGDADVFAVGANGTVLHQAGSVWVQEAAGLTGNDLTGVWVGADSVFVTGRAGRVYSKLLGKWDIEPGPAAGALTDDLFAVWGTGSGDARVVYVAGAKGVIARRDKTGWTREAQGLTTDSFVALLGTSEDGLVALGNKGNVLKRSGGKWTVSTARPLTQNGASGSSGCLIAKTGEMWGAGTQGVIMRQAGSEWVSEASPTNQPFSSIACAGPSDLFAVGPSGLILHKY